MSDPTSTNGPAAGFEKGRKGGPVRNTGSFLASLVTNIMSRSSWFGGGQADKRRNLQDECGHPDYGKDVDPELYQNLFDRDPIAARVVELFPRESWQVTPEVYEDEDADNTTLFEETIREVNRQLQSQGGSYQPKHGSQQGSPIWDALRKIDELSGVGRFGLVFFGIDDDRPLESPAAMRRDVKASPSGQRITDNPASVERQLLFLRCFTESQVQISKFEKNERSPRFGQPTEYEIAFHNPQDNTALSYQPQQWTKVHWTRCLHVAESHSTSPTFAKPRLEQVLDRVLDAQKVYGSSAEMYYKGAFPGLSLETPPQMAADADIDYDSALDQMEAYSNGLQRFLALVGLTVKSLAPQVVDPTPQIERQIEAICIKIGCPKRIFMGSERGELASSQDDAAWNDRLKERHLNYLSPCLIAPFFQRLIDLRILPVPKQFYVLWPDLTSQTAKEKSAVTFQLTQALAQYVSSGAYLIMALTDFLIRVFGMDEGEAEIVVMNADAERDKWVKAIGPSPAQIQADAAKAKAEALAKRPPGISGGSAGDGGGRDGPQRRAAT